MAKQLTESDVRFTLEVEFEDIPVRGNAMASGDDEFDKQVEDEIIRRLEQGDVWAWAAVTVTAHYGPLKGRDHLGGCSYESEEDFKRDGYYEDMKAQALDELQSQVDDLAEKICN